MNQPYEHLDLMSATPSQRELWARLQAFILDKPDVPLPLSRRLARHHGWCYGYALRAIEEYKKFVFLAVVTGQGVTPSVDVDAVWHFHLAYTESYWTTLCGQVLQQPLHHHPTQGRPGQQDFFKTAYQNTLTQYEYCFGQRPPEDIWPSPAVRFGAQTNSLTISLNRYWVIPKSPRSWIEALGQRLRPVQYLAIALAAAALFGVGSGALSGAVADAGPEIHLGSLASAPPGMISPPMDVINHDIDHNHDAKPPSATEIWLRRILMWGILGYAGLLVVAAIGYLLGQIWVGITNEFSQSSRSTYSCTSASSDDHPPDDNVCGACI